MIGGCSHTAAERGLDDVHPGVFAMVPCWLADTAQPVVTEVNLDAAAENGDQFHPDAERRGEWVHAAWDRGLRRYRVLRAEPPRYEVEFQENGGGTLTTSHVIEVEVRHRTIDVDGRPVRVRVLRVLSIRAN